MGLSSNPDRADVLDGSLLQGTISVSTSAVEAKVGVSRLDERQLLRIYNNSNVTVYVGNASVTSSNGEPIVKGQWYEIPAGDNLAIYLITASGTATDVRITEIA